jgi:hypothetical protein
MGKKSLNGLETIFLRSKNVLMDERSKLESGNLLFHWLGLSYNPLNVTKTCLISALIFLLHLTLCAGPVRISFLQQTDALQDTINFLNEHGISEPNTGIFKQAVSQYYAEPFIFNYEKFPEPTNGFYLFNSSKNLVAALANRLPATKHSFGINCMDTVVLLTGGQLQTRLHPDDIFGPFMVSRDTTNGECVGFLATPRDAFSHMYQAYYLGETQEYFPQSMQDSRICVSAALFRWHILPMSCKEENIESMAFEVLRTTWKQETVRFPAQCEVVLVHNVSISQHTISMCHTGLLFHNKDGYVYLEKAGGCGPFVRLDLDEKTDLLPWLAAANDESNSNSVQFATFNDTSINRLTRNSRFSKNEKTNQ